MYIYGMDNERERKRKKKEKLLKKYAQFYQDPNKNDNQNNM